MLLCCRMVGHSRRRLSYGYWGRCIETSGQFTIYFIVSPSNQDIQVNLPYVAWICAFNTTVILGYLLLDLVFFPSPLSKSIYSPTSKLKVQPDPTLLNHGRRNYRGGDDTATAAPLLEAINKNGLVFFLLVRPSAHRK